jgi:pilus assembly protein CpaB
MGAVRIAILAAAAFAAIGLALIVRQVATHHATSSASAAMPRVIIRDAGKPMTQVLVAHRDLAVGTRLTSGDLDWQPWPADAVNALYITDGQAAVVQPVDPTDAAKAKAGQAAKLAANAVTGAIGPMEQAYGSIVREPLLAHEPVTKAKLVRGGEGGVLAVALRPGMRAMSVNLNVGSAAGGFILPGDRVDVMQGRADTSGGAHGFMAQTVLRNIRILAIDQATQAPKSGQSMIGSVATLEVAAGDVEALLKAKAQGDVVLVLRSYADARGPTGHVGTSSQAVGVVRIYRAGQPSDVTVSP